MTGIHAACTGCYELIPITPGQLFGLVVIGAFLLTFLVAVAYGLSRYNR